MSVNQSFSSTTLGLQSASNTYVRYRPYPTIYSRSAGEVKGIVDKYSSENVSVSEFTENFHSKKSRGQLIDFTRLSNSRLEFSQTRAAFSGNRRKSSTSLPCDSDYEVCGGCSHALSSFRWYGSDPATPDIDAVIQAAAANARSGAFMLLVELKELPKTIALIGQFRQRYNSRVRQVLRKSKSRYPGLKKASDILSMFGDVWLEYRYGWRQLVYSSEDLVSAYRDLGKSEYFIKTGKAVESASVPLSVGEITYLRSTKAQGISSHDMTLVNSVTARSTVAVKISRLAAAIDTNIAAFLWEVMPYSFVADWFFNLGDLFRAHWPNPFIQGQVACYSIKRTISANVVGTVGTTASDCSSVHGSSPIYWTMRSETYDRYPVPDVPVSLTFRNRLDAPKLADLFALAYRPHQIADLYRSIRI